MLERIGGQAYCLALPDPQDKWEVEEILDKRKIKDTIHYLVKWTSWPSEYNSYEPAAHLTQRTQSHRGFRTKTQAEDEGRCSCQESLSCLSLSRLSRLSLFCFEPLG